MTASFTLETWKARVAVWWQIHAPDWSANQPRRGHTLIRLGIKHGPSAAKWMSLSVTRGELWQIWTHPVL